MKKRVLVFTNEIAPYRIPFFNRLHQEKAYEFLFVFNHTKSWRRHWRIDLGEIGFRYHVLDSPRPHRESLSFNGIQLIKIYRDFSPHIVIIGGFYLNNLLALGMARILGKKIVFWGEFSEHAFRSLPRWKQLYQRLLIKHMCHYTISSGTMGKEFCDGLLDPRRNFMSLITIDYLEGLEVKEVHDPISMLYVGTFSQRKGIDLLLQTFKKLQQGIPSLQLTLIGDGDWKPYQAVVEELHIQHVRFLPFMQKDELSRYYEDHDVFLFFSRMDPWGLVINEAMNYGLAIVCSKYAGASRDLVEKRNGLVIDPYDISESAAEIAAMIKDRAALLEMKKASRTVLKEKDNKRAVVQFIDALDHITSSDDV